MVSTRPQIARTEIHPIQTTTPTDQEFLTGIKVTKTTTIAGLFFVRGICLRLAQCGDPSVARQCPLLMLWTAPPPARECHESGCC